jgi:hypothetical protein
MKATRSAAYDYFTSRGLRPTAPEGLNAALRLVLDEMPTMLYGEPTEELTSEEQSETAVQYAAIIESSLTTKEAATRMAIPESQVRQMIARRTLYSILLNNRRYIPIFQFEKDGPLVANITKVNAALSPDLHPVEVYDWFTQPDSDLFVGDDVDATMSPLSWLRSGGDVKKLVMLGRRL